jgi:hypothetical protein
MMMMMMMMMMRQCVCHASRKTAVVELLAVSIAGPRCSMPWLTVEFAAAKEQHLKPSLLLFSCYCMSVMTIRA